MRPIAGLILAALMTAAGCSAAAATPAPSVADSALVWCLRSENRAAIASAFLDLRLDRETRDITTWTTPYFHDSRPFNGLLADLASGRMAETDSDAEVHKRFIQAWQELSPETFARACSAAFEAR